MLRVGWYAVLACAARDEGPEVWRGVPVVSAWVLPTVR